MQYVVRKFDKCLHPSDLHSLANRVLPPYMWQSDTIDREMFCYHAKVIVPTSEVLLRMDCIVKHLLEGESCDIICQNVFGADFSKDLDCFDLVFEHAHDHAL